MTPIRTIAFVGLGNMGVPMAAQLAAKGFALALYDRRPEAARAFAAAHGGRAATSLADAARDADAAITMLPDDTAVRDVVLGEGGLASALAPGATVIDMGTSDPCATIEIGAELAKRGIHYVDAPVMGGVVFAKDATLDVMAGGSDADVERCLPVFCGGRPPGLPLWCARLGPCAQGARQLCQCVRAGEPDRGARHRAEIRPRQQDHGRRDGAYVHRAASIRWKRK